LAEKCPYYKSVLENPEKLKNCPLSGSCPHFKDGKGHGHEAYAEAAKKCPHLSGKHTGEEKVESTETKQQEESFREEL
jgi:hypothetical protein